MNAKQVEGFKNPGGEFRGAPFWAWNGTLDPEETRRQIRIMKRMGLGGFFMHSRVGLDTAYLSKEWFDVVRACIDEADKLDMTAWLYDEDRWPSGAAGGFVTKNPDFRHRYLLMEPVANPKKLVTSGETLAVFVAEIVEDELKSHRRVAVNRIPRKLSRGETLLHFRVVIDPENSWHNGQTYLDTMNHEAVKEFIRVTHEAYKREIGARFGGRVPGIFTDEPNYGIYMSSIDEETKRVPWTGALPSVFKKRHGYDLLERLPEVFLDRSDQTIARTRYHFVDCATHLFVDAFARQIGEWCEENGMLHTGHVLLEDSLSRQLGVVGAAMRFYEHMQAPGMDLLTEYYRFYDTAKQVSSVARQFGRKWRLTETYGCTGWDFPFAGHKATSDWQVALGINLRCQHLSWYTMLGEAKRDYPAGIFHQSPWWRHYAKVEDYFARVHEAMTKGVEVRDLLVIHPIESMWTMGRKDFRAHRDVKDYDRMFVALRDTLLSRQLDFDYGDEDILARHGSVDAKTSLLKVAQADYKAVIVPPMKTIRKTTLDLLKSFRRAGGLVVFAGDVADHVDAEPSEAAANVAAECVKAPAKGPKLAAAVDAATRRLSITTRKGGPIPSALHLLREDDDGFHLFVCNSGHKKNELKPSLDDKTMVRDRTKGYPAVVVSGFGECQGKPLELDPETGEIFTADAKRGGDEWRVSTSLPPLGSRIFLFPKRRQTTRFPKRKRRKTVRGGTLKPKHWDLVLSEDNVLLLDAPRFKIGGGKWRKKREILRVDRLVRESLGATRRGGRMIQPWAREKRGAGGKTTPVSLIYEFDVKTLPKTLIHLGIEVPETFKITLNETVFSADDDDGWWCDQSLRTIPIDPPAFRLGRNELRLDCDYHADHPGLEIVYLLGKFGVKLKGRKSVVTAAPEALKIGDWVKQGLPFYSGNVGYAATIRPKLKKGERYVLEFPTFRGTAIRVVVNGEEAGIAAWPPYELDVTPFLKKGANDLVIEVLGHRRNSHGPLHHAEKWPRWTGPNQFITTGDEWTDDYQLVPCGLLEPPRFSILK